MATKLVAIVLFKRGNFSLMAVVYAFEVRHMKQYGRHPIGRILLFSVFLILVAFAAVHYLQKKNTDPLQIPDVEKAEFVGRAANQFISMGGTPNMLVMNFQNGDSIRVEDAVSAAAKKLANGNTEVHADSVPGQITVYQSKQVWRIISPELKTWLEDDWSKELPRVK